MKKHAMVILAITFLFGLGPLAKAEVGDDIVVTVPFEFVVSGKTLPAGTYKVSSVSDDNFGALILTDRDNGTSVFVRPHEGQSAPANEPHVSFQRVGGQYYLSSIQTKRDVYGVPVSRSTGLISTKQRESR
jgi:hypothetical protein